jgi:uncharacterized protein
MNSSTELTSVPISIGKLDCAVDSPAADTAHVGVAIIGHPHPLYGGSRDNKVVQTLARALVTLGYTVWRPNFRGVGSTSGQFDDGTGETADLLELVRTIRRPARERLILAGFSFGSFVIAQVAQALAAGERPADGLILVGTAVSRWSVPAVPTDSLIIHGELDDTVPLAAVFDWARKHDLLVTVIPGADHFFHRRLTAIKSLVTRYFSTPTRIDPTSSEPQR